MKKLSTLLLLASALYANAQNVGIGTTSPLARLHVTDSSVVFSAAGVASPSPGKPPISGQGRRMMWYADKAAFRVGYVNTTNWDKDSVGEYSAALGNNNNASGYTSFAAGNTNTASGECSVALGRETKAFGDFSTSIGFTTTASAVYSTAMGYSSIASGPYSSAIGSQALASGDYSVAMGSSTRALGNVSMATGRFTIASADYSNAMGYLSTASGNYSTAMGSSIASGDYAFAVGTSHAVANSSSTLGYETWAKANGGTAVGAFNDNADNPNPTVPAPTDRLFQIGNGTPSARTNAFTVLRNGNTGIAITTPNAPLQFSNTTVNRKIVLYDGFNNDNQYFGFGVTYDGIGHLRYQVDNPTAQHVFYAGTSPTTSNWLFTINGDGNAFMPGVLSQSSDARLKTNILPITSALNNLLQLNAYHYQWKNQSLDQSTQVGIIAQEVQKLYPELVKENAKGELSVNYSGLIPLLITAMKEQELEIQQQGKQISTLNQENKELRKMKRELEELKKMVKSPVSKN
jgi:hypothetical protein